MKETQGRAEPRLLSDGRVALARGGGATRTEQMPHKPLPPAPPNNGFFPWKDYEIATPTFRLTPVEKPDMSPYLVHMTGRAEIAAILRGDNAPPGLEAECGFLQAGIPTQSKGAFFADVVCFTESPTFAIDFFRYRSYARWRANQLYGVGFAKESLVTEGVMPAIYLSHADTTRLVALYEGILLQDEAFAAESLEQRLIEFVEGIYPLSTPLLELEGDQGFLWEREWRYPRPPGFAFPHEDVRVICCPEEEQAEIADLLGNHAAAVTFVRTWTEFSDVTDYLARQRKIWALTPVEAEKAKKLAALENLLLGRTVALHAVEGYLHKLEKAASELNATLKVEAQLKKDIAKLNAAIAALKK